MVNGDAAVGWGQVAELLGHSDFIDAVAWSPDGLQLASGGRDNTARVWDLASATCVSVLEGNHHWVEQLRWSPDGSRLVSVDDDHMVRVWDPRSGVCTHMFNGHRDTVDWSPDSSRLTTANVSDDIVRVWDVRSGSCLHSLEGHVGIIWSVVWSPDGSKIASAGDDGTIRVWDAVSGLRLHRIRSNAGGVKALRWSPDGSRLASTDFLGSKVRVWNAATGLCEHVLESDNEVFSVGWSPDGSRVASRSGDGSVRVWDFADGGLKVLDPPKGVDSFGWSPDGSRLALATHSGSVWFWDVASDEFVHVLDEHFGEVAWSPDGLRLASSSFSGAFFEEDDSVNVVRVWGVRVEIGLSKPSTGDGDTTGSWVELLQFSVRKWMIRAACWSPDGSWLAAASGDKKVRVWNAETGACAHVLTHGRRSPSSVGWSPDGSRLVSAGRDRTVRVWDPFSGDLLHDLVGDTAAWCPVGSRLATANGYKICLWDAASGIQIQDLEHSAGTVEWIQWSPDGCFLASGTFLDSTVRVWDAATGRCVQVHHCISNSVVHWSPDGTQLSFVNDRSKGWILDAQTGLNKNTIQGRDVNSISWSPDGRLMAVVRNYEIQIQDTTTGEGKAALRSGQLESSESIRSAKWSSDSRLLASAGYGGSIRVWDVTVRRCAEWLKCPGGRVEWFDWRPDRSRLASVGQDGVLRVWGKQGEIGLGRPPTGEIGLSRPGNS